MASDSSALSTPPPNSDELSAAATSLQDTESKTAAGRGRKRAAGEGEQVSPKRQKRGIKKEVAEGKTRAGKHVEAAAAKIEAETVDGRASDTDTAEATTWKVTPKKAATPKKAKASTKDEAAQKGSQTSDKTDGTKAKRKRKTQEEKDAEMVPLAARTLGSKLFIGAHVSSAGGVHNAVVNSVHIGGNAFALFLKSQRKWANPPLVDDHCHAFIEGCAGKAYDAAKHVVPHGSYLVNLAHPDPERSKQAYDAFHDDLTRCQRLGIGLYNFHPGNSSGADSKEAAIKHLARQLNKAHADPATGDVVTLLETMATRGNTVGGTFEDLRDTIALVDRKDRVGVCL
ncbi:MAG: deoxyribonuclease IV, partial [Terriglobus roseus]|nr:deoxyribonuclease IV [Terriglobus roseus]